MFNCREVANQEMEFPIQPFQDVNLYFKKDLPFHLRRTAIGMVGNVIRFNLRNFYIAES